MREEYAREEDRADHVVCLIAPDPHAVLQTRPEPAPARPQTRAPSLFSLVRSRRFELLLRQAENDSRYRSIVSELSAPAAHDAV